MKIRRELYLTLLVLSILTLAGMCMLWAVARGLSDPSLLNRTAIGLILTAILGIGTLGATMAVLIRFRRDHVEDAEDLFP